MKIAVAKEHRDFYKKNGWIEIENIFSANQLSQINAAIDQSLAEKLTISPDKLFNALPETIYLQGHDLWRVSEYLRQLISQPRVAQIVSDLLEFKPLRVGFDQVLQAASESRFPRSSHYAKFLQETVSLQSISSLKGLVGAMLICLNDPIENLNEKENTDFFPNKAGNVTLLNPETPLDFSKLINSSKQRFYLITYAQSSSYYKHEPNDAHLHHLKMHGYSFNEKLTDRLNPIVYR